MVARSSLRAGWVIAACLLGCGVRAPAAIDVEALIRTRGPVEARRDLEIRILDDERDVQARLALAAVDDRLGRPAAAIDQLEAVVALGGPIGTRWNDDDRARLGRLLAARGRVRLARGAPSALSDLTRAGELGARVAPTELLQARAAAALVKLMHVDATVRAAGKAELADLATSEISDPAWLGARSSATAAQHGDFGAWLWAHGARRAAWEELAVWRRGSQLQSGPIHDAYVAAHAWWTPPRVATPHPPRLAIGTEPPPSDARDPFGAALDRYVRGRLGRQVPSVAAIATGWRRDGAVADRHARELVARSVDAALGHAVVGTAFDALGDPARARQAWTAAIEASPEPAFLREYAQAVARAGDPDAALIHATTAAAASGDSAVVWIAVARDLERVGSHVHALEAARSAIDLASGDTIVDAIDVAVAASRALGRSSQADALEQRRSRLLGPPPEPSADPALTAALEAHRRMPTAGTAALLWVASREHPRDLASRVELLRVIDRDDPRRAAIIGELVACAGDPDPDLARAAVAAVSESVR
ncbi:MAG: hypothetical protein AB7P03_29140 [Kofleriaceae bacterium]